MLSPDSTVVIADSLKAVATVTKVVATSPSTLLDGISGLLAALTPLFGLLVTTGLLYKYLPWLKNWPNFLIPFLNSVITFLTVFNGPAVAHAGIFGDFFRVLSFPAKAAGSMLLSAAASLFFETYIRPILDKLGIKPVPPSTIVPSK